MTLSWVPCNWLVWFSAVYYVSFTGLTSAQTVTLTSSMEQDGKQAVCLGEVVTFTCVVTDEVGLQWIAEPFISQSGHGSIIFIVSVQVGDMAVDDSGQFRAVITSATQRGFFGDLTSELTVTASAALDGTVVQCTDTASIVMRKSLILAAPPSPPQQPSYSVLQYHLNDFTVAVQWERPASDGGVGIDSYTLTGAGITAPLTVCSELLMTTLTLSYNKMHMVSITASNCAGESTASVLTIHEVIPADCGDPSTLINGFVMAYDSTLEGSQIVFQCSPGFVPSHQMMSVCAANGSWTPDPAGLVCRVDCGMPIIINGSVNYTTTVEGSTATYQCNVGLIPEEVITAICMENGEWAPDPAETGCRQPASCGVPPSPASGSVEFTTTLEGSIAAFQCDTGLVLEEQFAAVCIASGEWVPNIGNLSCSQPEPLSPCLRIAAAIGITFVLSSILSFTAGLLVALVIAYSYIQQLKSRYSPRDPQHPVPMYEEVSMVTSKDIELKENVAYGPVSH